MSNPLALAFAAVTATSVALALTFVRLERPGAYAITKTVASLGFLGVALAVGAMEAPWSRVAFAALVLSAAGDVALSVRGRTGFFVGLACFMVAHGAYTVAFGMYGVGGATLGVTTVLAALGMGGVWWVLRRRIPAALRVAVGAYVIILAAMVATGAAAAVAHGATWLGAGAVLVAGSDVAVARERFGRSMFANKLAGLPAYYLGQILIAASLGGG
ncbi:MAG: lysoplasmalogenase family protein [Trueperaceae bacterium]|nr:lysoplasmalogenase family protein [Trueperaceae bacterium]